VNVDWYWPVVIQKFVTKHVKNAYILCKEIMITNFILMENDMNIGLELVIFGITMRLIMNYEIL
jgi:hypothetical protein